MTDLCQRLDARIFSAPGTAHHGPVRMSTPSGVLPNGLVEGANYYITEREGQEGITIEKDVACQGRRRIEPACATTAGNGVRLCGECAYEFLRNDTIVLDADAEKKARTNLARVRVRALRKRQCRDRATPLMLLGNEVAYSRHDDAALAAKAWHDVSKELLEEAFGNVEQRIIAAEQRGGHKGRKTIEWLGCWMKKIMDEMGRRQIAWQERYDLAEQMTAAGFEVL